MQQTDQLSKALIINSNPGRRRLLGKILTEYGYQVREVEEIDQAVELFKTENFSLILNELGSLEFSGMEVLDIIRGFGTKAKVVLIAPDVGTELYIKARAQGAFDCISKSLGISALRGVIAAAKK